MLRGRVTTPGPRISGRVEWLVVVAMASALDVVANWLGLTWHSSIVLGQSSTRRQSPQKDSGVPIGLVDLSPSMLSEGQSNERQSPLKGMRY